jgi:hypothetical protein
MQKTSKSQKNSVKGAKLEVSQYLTSNCTIES